MRRISTGAAFRKERATWKKGRVDEGVRGRMQLTKRLKFITNGLKGYH
jgi:hypothetical protein